MAGAKIASIKAVSTPYKGYRRTDYTFCSHKTTVRLTENGNRRSLKYSKGYCDKYVVK